MAGENRVVISQSMLKDDAEHSAEAQEPVSLQPETEHHEHGFDLERLNADLEATFEGEEPADGEPRVSPYLKMRPRDREEMSVARRPVVGTDGKEYYAMRLSTPFRATSHEHQVIAVESFTAESYESFADLQQEVDRLQNEPAILPNGFKVDSAGFYGGGAEEGTDATTREANEPDRFVLKLTREATDDQDEQTIIISYQRPSGVQTSRKGTPNDLEQPPMWVLVEDPTAAALKDGDLDSLATAFGEAGLIGLQNLVEPQEGNYTSLETACLHAALRIQHRHESGRRQAEIARLQREIDALRAEIPQELLGRLDIFLGQRAQALHLMETMREPNPQPLELGEAGDTYLGDAGALVPVDPEIIALPTEGEQPNLDELPPEEFVPDGKGAYIPLAQLENLLAETAGGDEAAQSLVEAALAQQDLEQDAAIAEKAEKEIAQEVAQEQTTVRVKGEPITISGKSFREAYAALLDQLGDGENADEMLQTLRKNGVDPESPDMRSLVILHIYATVMAAEARVHSTKSLESIIRQVDQHLGEVQEVAAQESELLAEAKAEAKAPEILVQQVNQAGDRNAELIASLGKLVAALSKEARPQPQKRDRLQEALEKMAEQQAAAMEAYRNAVGVTMTQTVQNTVSTSGQSPIVILLGAANGAKIPVTAPVEPRVTYPAYPGYPTVLMANGLSPAGFYSLPGEQRTSTVQETMINPAVIAEAVRQALGQAGIQQAAQQAAPNQEAQINVPPPPPGISPEVFKEILQAVQKTETDGDGNGDNTAVIAAIKEIIEKLNADPGTQQVMVEAEGASATATLSITGEMMQPILSVLETQNQSMIAQIESLKREFAEQDEETRRRLTELQAEKDALETAAKEEAKIQVDAEATKEGPGLQEGEPPVSPETDVLPGADGAPATDFASIDAAFNAANRSEEEQWGLPTPPDGEDATTPSATVADGEPTGEPTDDGSPEAELREGQVAQEIADLEASMLEAQQYLEAKEDKVAGWKRFLRSAAEVMTSVVGSSVGRAVIGGLVTAGMIGVGVATAGIGGIAIAAVTGAVGGGLSAGVFSSVVHFRVFHRDKHAIASEYSRKGHKVFGAFKNAGHEAIFYDTYHMDQRLAQLGETYNKLSAIDLSDPEAYTLAKLEGNGLTRDEIVQAFQQLYYVREMTNFVGLNGVRLPEGFQLHGVDNIQDALNRLVVQLPAIIEQNDELNAAEMVEAVQPQIDADYNKALWVATKNKALKGAVIGGVTGAALQIFENLQSTGNILGNQAGSGAEAVDGVGGAAQAQQEAAQSQQEALSGLSEAQQNARALQTDSINSLAAETGKTPEELMRFAGNDGIFDQTEVGELQSFLLDSGSTAEVISLAPGSETIQINQLPEAWQSGMARLGVSPDKSIYFGAGGNEWGVAQGQALEMLNEAGYDISTAGGFSAWAEASRNIVDGQSVDVASLAANYGLEQAQGGASILPPNVTPIFGDLLQSSRVYTEAQTHFEGIITNAQEVLSGAETAAQAGEAAAQAGGVAVADTGGNVVQRGAGVAARIGNLPGAIGNRGAAIVENRESIFTSVKTGLGEFGSNVKGLFTSDRMRENLGQTARWLGGAMLLQAPITVLSWIGNGGHETGYDPQRVAATLPRQDGAGGPASTTTDDGGTPTDGAQPAPAPVPSPPPTTPTTGDEEPEVTPTTEQPGTAPEPIPTPAPAEVEVETEQEEVEPGTGDQTPPPAQPPTQPEGGATPPEGIGIAPVPNGRVETDEETGRFIAPAATWREQTGRVPENAFAHPGRYRALQTLREMGNWFARSTTGIFVQNPFDRQIGVELANQIRTNNRYYVLDANGRVEQRNVRLGSLRQGRMNVHAVEQMTRMRNELRGTVRDIIAQSLNMEFADEIAVLNADSKADIGLIREDRRALNLFKEGGKARANQEMADAFLGLLTVLNDPNNMGADNRLSQRGARQFYGLVQTMAGRDRNWTATSNASSRIGGYHGIPMVVTDALVRAALEMSGYEIDQDQRVPNQWWTNIDQLSRSVGLIDSSKGGLFNALKLIENYNQTGELVNQPVNVPTPPGTPQGGVPVPPPPPPASPQGGQQTGAPIPPPVPPQTGTPVPPPVPPQQGASTTPRQTHPPAAPRRPGPIPPPQPPQANAAPSPQAQRQGPIPPPVPPPAASTQPAAPTPQPPFYNPPRDDNGEAELQSPTGALPPIEDINAAFDVASEVEHNQVYT